MIRHLKVGGYEAQMHWRYGEMLGVGLCGASTRLKTPLQVRKSSPATLSCLESESQIAQNDKPLYSQVAHNVLKVAHSHRPLAFQASVGTDFMAWLAQPRAPSTASLLWGPN